jgi:hypothetical protein
VTSVLPHSAVIRNDVDQYLDITAAHIASQISNLKSSGSFRNIYKITLSTDCLLAKLPRNALPNPGVLRGVLQQIPILVSSTNESAHLVQLRRFVECVFWLVYFSDHSVEWSKFSLDPGRPIEKDLTKPISFNAHREASYYRNYASERFSTEPSGLVINAISDLNQAFGELSAAAHGASDVRKGKLYPPLQPLDSDQLAEFAKTYRRVASAGALVVAAYFQRQFDNLPPVHRQWFDWLIGPARSKKLQSGPFGLASGN